MSDDSGSLDRPVRRAAGAGKWPFELQIAYKLYLGTRTDIEDAVHLYTLFEENLSVTRLEHWVTQLQVEAEYERLERA